MHSHVEKGWEKFRKVEKSWRKMRKVEEIWRKLRKVEKSWGKLRKVGGSCGELRKDGESWGKWRKFKRSWGKLRKDEESWGKLRKVKKSHANWVRYEIWPICRFHCQSQSQMLLSMKLKLKWWFLSLGKSAVISDIRFFASVGSELHLRVLTRKNKLKRRITGTRGHWIYQNRTNTRGETKRRIWINLLNNFQNSHQKSYTTTAIRNTRDP